MHIRFLLVRAKKGHVETRYFILMLQEKEEKAKKTLNSATKRIQQLMSK